VECHQWNAHLLDVQEHKLFVGIVKLKIEEVTDFYRKEYDTPDTDGLLEMQEEWEKRKRSDTISESTVSSDKPGWKKNSSRYYTRVITFWRLVVTVKEM
jgi:hypothetical protein